jgi:enamine deaminase RidA (YjgF/YER057c/UK114 family)
MVIPLWGQHLVTISGTASIASDGTTLAPLDPDEQIRTTLSGIRSLLEPEGHTLDSPGLWTLYFKNRETWQAWTEGTTRGRFPRLRGVEIFADICREDLLFEAEVTLLASAHAPMASAHVPK